MTTGGSFMQNQQPSTLKEIRVHGTQDFPCAFYQTGTRIKGNMVKHHWHEEVELLYFSGGEFCLEVNMERFNISEECFYFINPGELHSISVEKNGGCVENAVVFHMDMLSSAYALDQIQTNLIQPVQNGSIQFPRCLLFLNNINSISSSSSYSTQAIVLNGIANKSVSFSNLKQNSSQYKFNLSKKGFISSYFS